MVDYTAKVIGRIIADTERVHERSKDPADGRRQ
jgi:hypothetical protein